ncbi:hypothetical protein BCR42DRAFT_202896 [Absidia repens]|uniref:Uncharacterized protein n=1 Tax=Absidia repens TaxID=90262 RepID=A0A1X2HKG6_9FUNG|nr:hypothetical protein BCR42DRAFT_202896 [Absidia repens]
MTKHLNEQQLDESERIGLTYGTRGALIGIGLGAVATVFAIKKSSNFRALSKPLQASMMVAGKVNRTLLEKLRVMGLGNISIADIFIFYFLFIT